MFVTGYYFHSLDCYERIATAANNNNNTATAATTTTTTLSDIRPYSLLQFHGVTLMVFHL
jgi:hypothetical protein